MNNLPLLLGRSKAKFIQLEIMARPKKEHQFFTIETALMYQREITIFAFKQAGILQGLEEYQTLAHIACHPLHRIGLPIAKKTFEKFGKLYSRYPDAVIEFLVVARRILNKWETSITGQVVIFLCRRTTIPVEERRILYTQKGDMIGVIMTDKFNGKERKISFNKKSEQEIGVLLFPKLKHIAALLDKELAEILKPEIEGVNSNCVKKARQELAKIYSEMKYWQNPIVREYQRTGIKTEEYEKITVLYLKGKK